MTTKEKLATEYLNLKKQFDGDNFKENITDNQMWYLTRNFKVQDLKDKIEAVKRAIINKEIRLRKEAYFATSEGQEYKKNIEDNITKYRNSWKEIHDNFENWIIKKVNEMIPGNWTARLNLSSYMSGNVEIGLVNRDPERNFTMQFGHEFTIHFDGYNYEKKTPRFDLNYGTVGAFDIFNDETRPLYLNGLATISNNKEFLQLLMAKFIENCNSIKEISKKIDELNKKLDNPVIA
jgi:hypothetical protein